MISDPVLPDVHYDVLLVYSVCMCYVMGYVQYCYVFVSDGMADDVLFVVIVAVKAFMVQLLSPRQISLKGTIKYIIVSYHIDSYIENIKGIKYMKRLPGQQSTVIDNL